MAALHHSAPFAGRTSDAPGAKSPLPPGIDRARHPETIERIVAAAEQIFAAQGLEGARTDAIARAARVNKALLYYYFKSKDDLYRFTLQTLLDQVSRRLQAAVQESGTARERLVRFVGAQFDFMSTHPNYPRLVQREVMSRGPSLPWIVQGYFGPLLRRLSATIRAGIASGEFRPVDPQQTALTIVSITVFYFAAAPVLGQVWKHDPLAPSRVAARRRSVLEFLERGLFQPPERVK